VYLVQLTVQESEILSDYVKYFPITTIRLRSHALLMRNRGLNLQDISPLVFRSKRTITRWLVEFNNKRLSSVFSGNVDNENAAKLTREQKRQIKAVLGEPPNKYGIPKEFWDVPKLKDYIKVQFGVVYESNISYHFLLRFSGLSFKYPDKLSPRRNEPLIRRQMIKVRKEINPLLKDPSWVVMAADETRVQLEAEIRRAWLVRGKRTVVKTEKSSEHQSYLGFLDQKDFTCQLFEIKRGNQIETIRVLRLLVKQYPDKRVCVVWDNARWHKGKLLRQELRRNNKLERLHLINFPPYAPESNPIEHVWQYAKGKTSNINKGDFQNIKDNFWGIISQRIFCYKI